VVCSYLKNKKTLVEINCLDVNCEIQQKRLEEKIIQYAVPQNSILGKLLFLIYVNDINTNKSNNIGIRLTIFAGNISILINSTEKQDLIFHLDSINASILPWFYKNRLIINDDKLLALEFNHKSNNKHIVFPDIIDLHTNMPEIKFLGVWLDHNLNWDCHMENLMVTLSKLFCYQNNEIIYM